MKQKTEADKTSAVCGVRAERLATLSRQVMTAAGKAGCCCTVAAAKRQRETAEGKSVWKTDSAAQQPRVDAEAGG